MLSSGFPRGHDTGAHTTYTYLFDRALRQGQLPVRWVEFVTPGNGQPLFNYYQVGLYYLVDAIHLLVPRLSDSLKVVVLGAWALGTWFIFLLFRRLGRWPALTAALVYSSAPYLLLDIYVRGAYPEFIAIGLVVGVLWSSDGWIRTGKAAFLLAFALLLGLSLISHLPTMVIAAVPLAGYVLWMWVTGQTTIRRLGGLVPGAMLGLGLAAFYVWPALTELRLISSGGLTAGGLDYHQHFVYPQQWFDHTWTNGTSIPGPNDTMSFQIGIVQTACLAGGLLLALGAIVTRRIGPWLAELVWWLFVAGLALFMMTSAALRVWEALPPLAFIQFPWRFLMLLAIACGAVAAILLSFVRPPVAQAVICLAVAIGLWVVSLDALQLARESPRETAQIDRAAWNETREARQSAFLMRGYDPVGAHGMPILPRERAEIARGTGTITEVDGSDTRVMLHAESQDGLLVTIREPDFPRWTVSVDGHERTPIIQPETSFLQVDVPSGAHEIEAKLIDTPVRARANRVTLISMLVWLVSVVFVVKTGPRRERRAEV